MYGSRSLKSWEGAVIRAAAFSYCAFIREMSGKSRKAERRCHSPRSCRSPSPSRISLLCSRASSNAGKSVPPNRARHSRSMETGCRARVSGGQRRSTLRARDV